MQDLLGTYLDVRALCLLLSDVNLVVAKLLPVDVVDALGRCSLVVRLLLAVVVCDVVRVCSRQPSGSRCSSRSGCCDCGWVSESAGTGCSTLSCPLVTMGVF